MSHHEGLKRYAPDKNQATVIRHSRHVMRQMKLELRLLAFRFVQ
jgi:hypothetical protein